MMKLHGIDVAQEEILSHQHVCDDSTSYFLHHALIIPVIC